MKIVRAHFKAEVLTLLRYPTFSVPTLIFPTMFFLFFVVPGTVDAPAATLMAFYAGFAVLGVAFFQFGVGTATDRISPWYTYLRTLPLPPRVLFTARVLATLMFATASAALVVLTAVLAESVTLTWQQWGRLVVALLAGGIPFALLGLAIGYWMTPKGALPSANLLYLLLAYAGGLWTGTAALPDPVAAISPYLPTGQWAELLDSAVGGEFRPRSLLIVLWAIAFGFFAGWGYRRDEGERFR